jgi:hypothetical protein
MLIFWLTPHAFFEISPDHCIRHYETCIHRVLQSASSCHQFTDFIVIAPLKSGLCVGDIIEIVTESPYQSYTGNFIYSFEVVIGISDCYDFYDLIGLKFQERRVIPNDVIAMFRGSSDQLKKIQLEISKQITNEHINHHISDLSNQHLYIIPLWTF